MTPQAESNGERDLRRGSKGAHSESNVQARGEEKHLAVDISRMSCSSSSVHKSKEDEDCFVQFADEDEDGPPDGLFFVIPYMDLKSLLTFERVSKPLKNEVNEILPWKKLHVKAPLSKVMSDGILLSLVKRAEGNLQCLRLEQCLRITDEGLASVISCSPALEKLHLPGCTGLSVEGIVRLVELHGVESRAKGMPGIKQLRLSGIYNIRLQHLDAVRAVVLHGDGNQVIPKVPVYWNTDPATNCNDDRAIDVEMCPRCFDDTARVVYDCTRESCKDAAKLDPSKACRGCSLCLPRCVSCGICLLGDEEYEVTICRDLVCVSCWLHLPKCSECNDAICKRHIDKFHLKDADATLICEDCLDGDYDEGPDVDFVGCWD